MASVNDGGTMDHQPLLSQSGLARASGRAGIATPGARLTTRGVAEARAALAPGSSTSAVTSTAPAATYTGKRTGGIKVDWRPFAGLSPTGTTRMHRGKLDARAEETEGDEINRYYDPSIGRYLQPEPLLSKAASFNFPGVGVKTVPEMLTLPPYAYARNNPLYYVDRNGANPAAIALVCLGGGCEGGAAAAAAAAAAVTGAVVAGVAAVKAICESRQAQCARKALAIFETCLFIEGDYALCLDKMQKFYTKCINTTGPI